MQYCCGPTTGYRNSAPAARECRCGGGCNTRKVYCNYFRYGQCHQEIVQSGPIACRVVTCVAALHRRRSGVHAPPARSTTRPRSTRSPVPHHAAARPRSCPTPAPSFESSPGNGHVRGRRCARAATSRRATVQRRCVVAAAAEILANVNSGISAAVDGTGAYVFGRGFGNALWYNRLAGGAWSGPQVLGGVPLTSDPVAVAAPERRIYVFARSENARGCGTAGSTTAPGRAGTRSQGTVTSNLAVAANPMGVFVFARGTDGSLWYRRLSSAARSGRGRRSAASASATRRPAPTTVACTCSCARPDARSGTAASTAPRGRAGCRSAATSPATPYGEQRARRSVRLRPWLRRRRSGATGASSGAGPASSPSTGAVSTNPIVGQTPRSACTAFCTRQRHRDVVGSLQRRLAWSGWQPLGGSFRPRRRRVTARPARRGAAAALAAAVGLVLVRRRRRVGRDRSDGRRATRPRRRGAVTHRPGPEPARSRSWPRRRRSTDSVALRRARTGSTKPGAHRHRHRRRDASGGGTQVSPRRPASGLPAGAGAGGAGDRPRCSSAPTPSAPTPRVTWEVRSTPGRPPPPTRRGSRSATSCCRRRRSGAVAQTLDLTVTNAHGPHGRAAAWYAGGVLRRGGPARRCSRRPTDQAGEAGGGRDRAPVAVDLRAVPERTSSPPRRARLGSLHVEVVAGFLVVGIVGRRSPRSSSSARPGGSPRSRRPRCTTSTTRFDWVVEHVPDDVAATLTPDDVRRILDFQVEFFKRKGVSSNGSTAYPAGTVVIGGAGDRRVHPRALRGDRRGATCPSRSTA